MKVSTEGSSQESPKRRSNLPSKPHGSGERLIDSYKSQTSWAFFLTVAIYILGIIGVIVSIGLGIWLAFSRSDFFERIVSVGLMFFGSGLLVMLIRRNPVETLKQARIDLIRTQVVLSGFQLHQEEIKKELSKVKNLDEITRKARIELLFSQIQSSTEKTAKNLGELPDLLDDL